MREDSEILGALTCPILVLFLFLSGSVVRQYWYHLHSDCPFGEEASSVKEQTAFAGAQRDTWQLVIL